MRIVVKEGHSQFADLLKDSECNLSSLLSLFDDTLIFLFDSEGRFIFGQGDEDLSLHISRDNFIDKKVSDIFPSNVSIPFEEAYKKNLRGELAEFSYKLDMKTHTGWFKATCSPIFRQGIFDGSLAVVRDVTEARNSSEALKTSEENYRTLVEMATMGIAIVSDGKLVFANPVTSDISGFSQEELLGKDFLQFLTLDEQSKVKKFNSNRTEGREAPVIYDSQFVRKDGSIIDVELSVRLIFYQGKQSTLAIMKNVSSQKQAERDLLSIQDTLKEMVADRTEELESYRNHLEDVVDERTTRLKNTVSLLRIEIEERSIAEEKAEHL
ncbi:MAG: PAS domain S-box protein, partial [Candidatus Sabulitectum sp.]|nr:PAS domain S-box protein [Candidatus Sabulitectum sp.]